MSATNGLPSNVGLCAPDSRMGRLAERLGLRVLDHATGAAKVPTWFWHLVQHCLSWPPREGSDGFYAHLEDMIREALGTESLEMLCDDPDTYLQLYLEKLE